MNNTLFLCISLSATKLHNLASTCSPLSVISVLFLHVISRHTLTQPPLAMDCVGNHILLASEPLEISLMEVHLEVRG